jgi:hypothetical protein
MAMKGRDNPIREAVSDRFVAATFLTISERVYGKIGRKFATELLSEIDQHGDEAVERCLSGADAGESDEPNPHAVEFLNACAELGVTTVAFEHDDDDLDVPCDMLCKAKFVVCMRTCPPWPLSTRIMCELACGVRLLACLAGC